MFQGIVQLHENRTVHRDIRGRNVLLTKDGHVKLIDFGLSVRLNMSTDKLNACVGSPGWLAPEVITCESDNEHAGYDNRVDVWALGKLCKTCLELINASKRRRKSTVQARPNVKNRHMLFGGCEASGKVP